MRVREIMKTKVIGVDITDSLHDAFLRMQKKSIKHLPVFENDSMVGIISDRDLLSRATYEHGTYMFPNQSVEKVMTAKVVQCSPDTKIQDALDMMLQQDIHCLPVVEQDQVVGILTVKDIMVALKCAAQD